MIERRQAAGEQIRCLIGSVRRDTEANVSGHCSHDRHDKQRVVDGDLHRVPDRSRRRPAIDIVNADDVGQENRVEQAALGCPGQMLPVFDIGVTRRLIARMRLHAVLDVADAVHVEGVEPDFLRHNGLTDAASVG
jgi:hypothetical protein